MSQGVIEVVSDVVCPWCWIGKKRLEQALQLMGRAGEAVRWRPFQLNPDLPREGMDRVAYRTRKFGSLEYSRQSEARVAANAEAGIDFRFDRIARQPYTFDAHRLIWMAGNEGVQDVIVERLFRAFFTEGADIGDPAVLRRIGLGGGLDGSAVDALLAGSAGAIEVAAEEREARIRGVSGVPSFFLDGRPVTSGAHPPELLARFLGQCSIEGGTCL